MKKISSMLVITSICLLQACSDNKTESVDTTKDSTTVSGADTTSHMDTSTNQASMADQPMFDQDTKNFVMKAADGGMMEVELGKIAQEKSKNPRVKNYADMIVADHTQANDDLKSTVGSRATLPATMSAEHQKHVAMMKNKSGTDFDKSYISMMIDDHKTDIAEFKKASANLKDASIKGFANDKLPVLQKHLDSAQAIHGSKM
ncbi:MAG: DUF4142 domain-containing protein [Ginsengibacter sp.]